MTNVFGTDPPPGWYATNDPGPLQLGHAFNVRVPSVVTHIRYFVPNVGLAATTGGTVGFYAWRSGEPDSTVTGTLTIPATVGWVTQELSPHLFVPADRPFGMALDFAAGDHWTGEAPASLPAAKQLLTCTASIFDFTATHLDTDITSWRVGGQYSTYTYFLDAEVAVSELASLDPAAMAEGDEIQMTRVVSGTINTITPITDAYTVNLAVLGGPLDGEDVDFWVPDTTLGLQSADMTLYKAVPEPDIPSLWEASDGSHWVYIGGGAYLCIEPGAEYAERSKTSRIDTPSLTPWTP